MVSPDTPGGYPVHTLGALTVSGYIAYNLLLMINAFLVFWLIFKPLNREIETGELLLSRL